MDRFKHVICDIPVKYPHIRQISDGHHVRIQLVTCISDLDGMASLNAAVYAFTLSYPSAPRILANVWYFSNVTMSG